MPNRYKIVLSNGSATNFYLLSDTEPRIDKDGNTKAPNSDFKIQIEVATQYNNKRVRGKKSYTMPRGTTMVKAIQSLQGKKAEIINKLKTNGTLKNKNIPVIVKGINSRKFKDCWKTYYQSRLSAEKIRESTFKAYEIMFNKYLKPLHNKNVDDITIQDVQAIVNKAKQKGLSASKISHIKPTIKPTLEYYDVMLNWTKLIEPKVANERKYTYPIETTSKIVKAMIEYENIQVKSIFMFLLTGRRIGEVISLRYENINWNNHTFKIDAKDVKNKIELEFILTPILADAIKSLGEVKATGKIFKYTAKWVLKLFKELTASMGIHDLVLHDIRSMVAQTSLNAGADVYDVSSMLGHKSIRTTEQRYVNKTKENAIKAQDAFTKTIGISSDVIDVEVMEPTNDKFNLIKNMYPNVKDEVIKHVIDVLEGNFLKFT